MDMHITGVPDRNPTAIGWWRFARIHGLHPTADIILYYGRLGAYEQKHLVFAPLSSRSSTDPTKHPFRSFTKPGYMCLIE